jgi:hypothetical protein
MPAGIISGGLSLLGGLFGGSSAKKAAEAQSRAQIESARIAADAQKFRPVGITSRFGTSQFTTDPTTGYLTGADYSLTPDVASLRDYLISQAQGAGIRTAEGAGGAQERLFQLGEGYLAQTPEEAAQRWMEAQQKLLQPSRERAQAGLTQNLFNTGRGGVAVAQGGMMGPANPEQQALLNAQLIQDLELATRAQEQGRAATTFGAGLFGTGLDLASGGYNPLKTQFGLAQNIEQAGQSPLDIGAQLGGRSAQAGANVGQTLFQGGTNAARAMYDANAYSPVGAAFSGVAGNKQLSQGIANLFSPFGNTPQGAYGQQGQYLAGALANPQTQQANMLAAENAWFQ